MGIKSADQKPPAKKPTKKGPSKEKDTPPVIKLMERLSAQLMAFRKREDVDLLKMSQFMEMGQSRYNEIEKVRNVNPEFGVSVAFLLKFAELEKISLSQLAQAIQDPKSESRSKRNKVDEALIDTFSQVKLEDRNLLCSLGRVATQSQAIQDRIKWWVEMGLDLFTMDIKEQLDFEMRVHQVLLKNKTGNRITSEQRRARLTTIMQELISLS